LSSTKDWQGVYHTTFGLNIAVDQYDMNFYRLLKFMRDQGVLSDFAHRSCELSFIMYGYHIVA